MQITFLSFIAKAHFFLMRSALIKIKEKEKKKLSQFKTFDNIFNFS